MELHKLQEEAYYDVLMAFHAETSSISSERIMIVHDLVKELKVPAKSHTGIEIGIRSHPLIKQLRNIEKEISELESLHLLKKKEKQKVITEETESDVKEKQKVIPEETESFPLELLREKDMPPPPNLPEKKPESSSPPSWGKVSPESLVDKHILIKLPDEDTYTSFYIKAYNPQMETHQLISFLSRHDDKDPCDWVDLRQIPVEDTKWLTGHPGYPTPNCYLKLGETILNKTSTTGDKRQLEKVNEQHSRQGMDKGKSIAYD